MIKKVRFTVPVTGSAGSATGSVDSPILNGRVVAVHLDYVDQPSTCDVVVKSITPDQTILAKTDTNTDGWYYPRVQVQNTSGTALTYDGTRGVYEMFAVDGYINVDVVQGDAGTVIATIIVES